MKKMLLLLVLFVFSAGAAGHFSLLASIIGKGFLQIILPAGFVLWVNRKEYWFHYLIRKLDHFNRNTLLVLFLFFGTGVLFDYVWLQELSILITMPVSLLVFGTALCLFRMFFEKGFRRFHRLTFARTSVYLIVHMTIWGLYTMGLDEYGVPAEFSVYARVVQVLGGLMLVLVFFRWGKKDHEVDPPTVEGMVRKLY
ncbi:hypothetical protein [Salimicrobium jeotgali]|uniref:hypothetical protein n=1 Tax=Salimicrobium jeotgali TaxID=1230341 RepID=UPI000C8164C1|nr:hypothetical protein [Salimicrobium jeotgali]